MQFVKGPDFPTGGQILGRAGIIDAYRTGRGSVKMRAKAAIEEGKRGRYEIVVTELPYQTSCSSIAGRIEELVDRRRPRGHRRRQRRLGRRQDPSRHHPQARRQRQRRDQQPVQAHPAADELRRSTWSPSSTACRARSTCAHGARRLRPPPGRRHHPAHAVPARQGAPSRAHPRGPHQGARRHRPDHRPHPGERRRRRPPRRR